MMMSDEAKNEFYKQTVWTRYVIAFLGVWLLAVAFSFNYTSSLLWWSDFLCGLALLASGVYALTGHNNFSPWDSCAIGLWLMAAPVLFWAPDSFVYLNDMSIGVLALTFGALIPGVPEDVLREGSKTPFDWSYNPSSWMQRLPIIALAILGWFFGVYMAGYQLGYRDDADFLFGKGTTKVLESGISGAFPMADAGFTALVFLLIAILACLGSSRRWHSMPWLVVVFGGLAILFGISNALYALLQPLVIGLWCGWCLVGAFCALGIIILAVDELVAVVMYLAEIRQTGKPMWQVFWQGDGGVVKEQKELLSHTVVEPFSITEMFRGIVTNWMQGSCVLIGALIMLTEHVFAIEPANLSGLHIVALLIFLVSVLALAEILSTLRYLNVILAVLLIGYAWITAELSITGALFYTLCGIALIGLSLWKREVRESYGRADKLIM